MSPLSRQSTIFLQSKLTEEPNSDPFWIDSIVSSSLHGETFSWSEGITTTLDCPPASPTDHLLPSFEDDHLGPPPATSDVVEHVSLLDFTANGYNVPFNIQPEDLYAVFSLHPTSLIKTTDYTTFSHHVAWTPPTNQLSARCSMMRTTPVYQRKPPPCAKPPRQHQHHATSPLPLSPRRSLQPVWFLDWSILRPCQPMIHTFTTSPSPQSVQITEPSRHLPALPPRPAPVIAWNPIAMLNTFPPPTTTIIALLSQPPTKSRRSAGQPSPGLPVAWSSLLPAPPPPNPRRASPLLAPAGVRTLTGVIYPLATSNAKIPPRSSQGGLASGALSPDATTPRKTSAFQTSSATS
jgi:hypothetical protein